MSKIAYFDCPTGIAGDMCLGALTEVGVPLTYLREQLAKLGIKQEYFLSIESVRRNQQAGTKFQVQLVEPSQSEQSQGTGDAAEHQHRHATAHAAAHAAAHSKAHSDTHSGAIAQTSVAQSHSEAQGHSHSHSHSETSYSHSSSTSEAEPPKAEPSGVHRHSSHHHSPYRNLPAIEQLIRQAQLPPRAEAWSLAVFRNLAIAEAAVHGTTVEDVHFHEVGAVDAIVDIVGTCLGLDYLDIDEIYCSPLPTGGGTVWTAHGRLPVPAPAVLKLFAMGQVPVYGNGIERELVTPTGAAIAITLAQAFGPPPPMCLQAIGLGAGTIDLPIPNLVRLWIGESDARPNVKNHHGNNRDATPSQITLLQTQLDDSSPQAIGYAFERLLEAGALDVFTQAIAMKKNRPGILLSVICPDDKIADCEAILFRETSTLGIRRQPQQRSILQRHWQTVTTAYGPVRIKVAGNCEQGEGINVQPEYEDCAAIARAQNLPWREVHQLALQAWHQAQAQQ